MESLIIWMVSGPHSKRRNPIFLIAMGGEAPQGRCRKKSGLGGVLHKMVTQGGDQGLSGGGEQKQMVREESREKKCSGCSRYVILSIASTGEAQLNPLLPSTGRSHQHILHSFS